MTPEFPVNFCLSQESSWGWPLRDTGRATTQGQHSSRLHACCQVASVKDARSLVFSEEEAGFSEPSRSEGRVRCVRRLQAEKRWV